MITPSYDQWNLAKEAVQLSNCIHHHRQLHPIELSSVVCDIRKKTQFEELNYLGHQLTGNSLKSLHNHGRWTLSLLRDNRFPSR